MKKRARKAAEDGKGALELIAECVHLLRTAPPGVLAAYYAGSVPFILGLLFFWSDMSRSAFATQRCFPASLGLACLFVWMKCWQAVFARGLSAHITMETPPRMSRGQVGRLVVVQAVTQPYGLLLIPVSLLLMLPFYAVYAFYQNLTALADGQSGDIRAVSRKAWNLALLWPRQNHILLWLLNPWVLAIGMLTAFGTMRFVLSQTPEVYEIEGILWFALALMIIFHFVLWFSPFGCVVAGNVALALLVMPQLLNKVFGIHTVFTLSGMHGIFNTTFLTCVYGITYLCLDPLAKAAYTLRCFYGESRTTGVDLSVRLAEAEQ